MKKMKTPKRVRSSRVLLSLVTGSIVLVLVGATVYATALPGVFTGGDDRPFFSGTLFGDISFAGSDASGEADAAELQGGNGAMGSQGGASLTSTPSMASISLAAMSPVLDKVSSQVADTSTAIENGTIQNGSSSQQGSNQSQDSNQSNTSDQSQGSSIQTAADAPAFSDEAEAAFHAHLVKYRDMMVADYEYLAEIYNYLYSSLEAGDEYIEPYPIDIETYIRQLDDRRIASFECIYDGKRISEGSKWYLAYCRLTSTYHDLVNATSILRNLNGGYATEVRKWIKYYNDYDSDPMNEFRQNYSQIKL